MKKSTVNPMKNPLLEELWAIRAQIEKEYDGDLDKYSDDLEKAHKTGKARVVVASDSAKKRAEKACAPPLAKMPRNPILDEIRATRAKLLREFDYDLDKLRDHIEAIGKAEGRKYVKLKPRRIRPKSSTRRTTVKKKSVKSKSSARRMKSA